MQLKCAESGEIGRRKQYDVKLSERLDFRNSSDTSPSLIVRAPCQDIVVIKHRSLETMPCVAYMWKSGTENQIPRIPNDPKARLIYKM